MPQKPLTALQRELAGARDEQILRVLSVVDAMPQRGDADALIAQLRPRLSILHPPRPLTLRRVLFAPLDALLVPAPAWRRGQPAIPRTALAPIAGVIERALDPIAQASIATNVAGRCLTDMEAVATAGAELWPRAAQILAAAETPPDWSDATGLTATDYASLAPPAAALLGQAVVLHRVVTRAADGIDPAPTELEILLAHAIQSGPAALTMMVALLVARLPRAERVMQVADDYAAKQTDPAARKSADTAVAFLLDSIESAPPPAADLAAAATTLTRTAAILANLHDNAASRPSRRARVEEIRKKIDQDCRERFTTELDAQLLTPAADLATADTAAIATLESTACDLRRFESTARRIGGPELYDKHLKRAGAALRPLPTDPFATLIDRARLVEILQGPEAAAALLPP